MSSETLVSSMPSPAPSCLVFFSGYFSFFFFICAAHAAHFISISLIFLRVCQRIKCYSKLHCHSLNVFGCSTISITIPFIVKSRCFLRTEKVNKKNYCSLFAVSACITHTDCFHYTVIQPSFYSSFCAHLAFDSFRTVKIVTVESHYLNEMHTNTCIVYGRSFCLFCHVDTVRTE